MNDSSAVTSHPPYDVPMARPFYPKALACFLISALCLAWLASLQLQSDRLAPPASQPSTAPVKTTQVKPAETKTPATPKAPSRQLSDTDFLLAEVDVLQALAQEEDVGDFRKIANAMRPYTYSTNGAVKDLSTRELTRVMLTHDKQTLKSVADAAAQAQALAESKDFGRALEVLRTALKNIPEDANWNGMGPDKKLMDMAAEFEKKRAAEREAVLSGVEEALRKKEPAAKQRLDIALQHPDAVIHDEARAIQNRMADEAIKEVAAGRAQERNSREEWVRFFKRLSGMISEGDLAGATELIEQPPFEAILKGGVSDPDKVLRQCANDITAIRALYDEALKDARGLRKQVSFRLRKGGQAAGTLIGTNGQMLRIMPGKGAELGVKITDLPAEGIRGLLDSSLKKKPSIALALASLDAHENFAEAQTIITTAYESAREPLPLHWRERFKVEKTVQKTQAAEEKLVALKKAVASENSDDITAALAEAKPIVAELNELGALSAENRELLSKAEKIAVKKQLFTIFLQNGKSPEANYRGINTDQITDYRDSLRRTDVGVGYGLKLGASGGLQRILFKFDGLETVVGNGRVRKATLQLYQIDSPQFENAAIGVFRVKRQWIPDAGSWMSFDGQKDHDWAIPGASGEADIEPKEDAKITLDKKANQWRWWDITKFVQDVLAGKAQNNGLLIKVLNGEPEFHVRFYPESDLDRGKDSNFRPKIVLEISKDAE